MRSGTFCTMLGEVQVRRRSVDRVAAEDHEHFDPPSLHVLHEFAQRSRAVARLGVDGDRVGHGLADVAEMIVQGVRQQMDDGRLAVSGQHQAAAAMGIEVLGDRGNPFFPAGRPPGRPAATPSFAATARASPSISPARKRQPMVGLGPGATDGRFDHVQAVHLAPCGVLRRGPHPPPRHEVGRIAEVSGTALQEVGIQRKHHVGLAEIVNRVDRLRQTPSGLPARPYPDGSARRRAILPRAGLSAGFRFAAASVGETMVSVNSRSPAPRCWRCFCMASRMAAAPRPRCAFAPGE